MHVNLDTKKFKEAISTICSLPGYNDHVLLLTAKDEELLLEGACSGSYVKLSVPATVKEPGEISVDVDYLYKLTLQPTVDLQQKGTKLFFSSGQIHGHIDLAQTNNVANQRPIKEITCNIHLESGLLLEAISKTNLVPAIPNPNHGVHLVIENDTIKTACNDQYRGSIFKKALSIAQSEKLSLMLRTQALMSILSRIDNMQIAVGQNGGIFRVMGTNFEFTYPSIQAEPDDVEAFFNELDFGASQRVVVRHEAFVDDVKATISLIRGSLGFEIKHNLSFADSTIVLKVTSAYGELMANHALEESVAKPFETTLSSKYLLEMLHLLTSEEQLTLYVWDSHIVFESMDKSYRSAMPTILDVQ